MSEEKKPAAAAPKAVAPTIEKKREKKKWTLERCSKFARRYSSEQEWKVGAPSSYKAASAQGWLKECLGLMKKGHAPKFKKSA